MRTSWSGPTKPPRAGREDHPTFGKWILKADGNNDGKAITAIYARRVCRTARGFLWWLRTSEDGYRDITERWLATLTMQRERTGKVAERVFFTADEVRKIVALPADSLTVQRDQAAVASCSCRGCGPALS